jgi:deoxycytidine triphosphate deaminase
MARILNQHDLLDAVTHSTFIKGDSPASAEVARYDSRVSSRILKAGFIRPVNADLWSEPEERDSCIAPTEMVFILTEERLELPPNMFAHLSPKGKWATLESWPWPFSVFQSN